MVPKSSDINSAVAYLFQGTDLFMYGTDRVHVWYFTDPNHVACVNHDQLTQ